MFVKMRSLSALASLFVMTIAAPLFAQDTRTVTEPVFPTTCTALAAQQAITAGEPTSETQLDTSRIQTAMNACGAGKAVELTVSGANNAFLIAPLTIPNGVTLIVDAGVTVFASRNPADYQIGVVGGSQEACGTVGTAGNGCSPLFNVNNGSTSTGAGIMGFGIINGRGGDKLLLNGVAQTYSWWDLANTANTGSNSQNNPILMSIKKASNFTLYKITLMNSPMFHVKWQNATGFTAWGVKIVTPYSARNTDGIDPGDNVSNISIINSYLSDGDDNVAVGATAGNPASNISITNVHTYAGHGVSIGSYTAGGVSNMAVTGLYQSGNLQDTNSTGLRIKSSADRGGVVKNISYTNVCIQNVRFPIQFNPIYNNVTTGSLPPTFQNIGLHSVTVQNTSVNSNFDVQGYSANFPLTIQFDNLAFANGVTLTPAPKYATIQLGPGPVAPASLQTINATGVTYTGNITNPNQARFVCNAASYPFLAGELFLSTPAVTNARTLALGNPASFTLNAVLEITEAASPTPTSPIQFYEGATQVGTATLSGNGTVASLTLSNVASGAHTYVARYPADANYTQVIFGSVTVNVNTIATTTTLATSAANAVYGNSVTLTATVAQGTGSTVPTGTVTFVSAGATLGTGTLASGVATLTLNNLPTGANTITATYPGNTNFAASDSNASPTAVTIVPAGTTTTLAAPATATYGNTVTLTATVASGTTGAPSGTVTFSDGATTLGTITLTPGTNTSTAVLTTSTLNSGPHTITASYGGDTNYNASNSASSAVTIFTASTTTSLGFTGTSVPFGSAVTMLATINGSNSTTAGTVTFSEGGTVLATVAVANGTAAYTTSALAIGQHSIIASYSGDGNYTPSASNPTTLTIVQAASNTTIAASSTNPVYGTNDTFTATISTTSSGTPTGTVTFVEGVTVLASNVSVSTTGGVTTASFSETLLSGGTHSINAVYSGDGNFTGSTSPTISITVSAGASTTVLAPLSPVTYGAPVTLQATMSSTVQGVPFTGSVQFFDGSASLGSGTVSSNNKATLAVSPALGAGTHSLTAVFSGNANYATSTSAPQTLTVTKASTTMSGSSNPTTISYGQSTALTGTVSPNTVTGTVSFADQNGTLGTATVSSGAGTLNISTLGGGPHNIVATYSGDSNYNGVGSATFFVTVNQAISTTTLVVTPNNPVYSSAVTFTATVPGGATGTVTFKDGSTSVGSGTVAVVNGQTRATFTTSSLLGGSHSITAVYGGDANFTGSTSSAQVLTVSPAATTTVLSGAAASVVYGASVTLTATITPSGTSGPETGTVTFKDGANMLGTQPMTYVNGVAVVVLSVPNLTGGTHTFTATYNGDSNFVASTSATATTTVTPAATTITASSNPSTTIYQNAVTLQATVTSSGSAAPTGTVTFKDAGITVVTGGVNGNGTASYATNPYLPAGVHRSLRCIAGTRTMRDRRAAPLR